MSRLAIATLHYGFNEGAILQAYCVAKVFEAAIPNATTCIIDQRYPSKVKAYGPPKNPRLKTLLYAVDHWLPLSEKQFSSDSHTDSMNYVRESFDGLIVGSDQVWNLRFSKRFFGLMTVQNTPFFTPFPNFYWPDNTIDVPRVAFSPAVGTFQWQETPSRLKRQMKEILEGFSLLSVRDERTCSFLEWLSPELRDRAYKLPDPTFIADIMSDEHAMSAEVKLREAGLKSGVAACGIVASENATILKAADQIRAMGYRIASISYANSAADLNLHELPLSPIEWAHSFRQFNFCITERMHAAIFCIQNGTPFIAIDINETADGGVTKLSDLMNELGIGHFCLAKSAASPDAIGQLVQEIQNGAWNWSDIRTKLARIKEPADAFLEEARQLWSQ